MITGAERYNIELRDFFIEKLKANLNSIKDGKIPLSWKIDWREFAKKSGIYLPKGYYNRKSTKKTILDKKSQDNSLDSFLNIKKLFINLFFCNIKEDLFRSLLISSLI